MLGRRVIYLEKRGVREKRIAVKTTNKRGLSLIVALKILLNKSEILFSTGNEV